MPESLRQVHLPSYEPVPRAVIESLPESAIRRYLIVPVALSQGRLVVAVPRTHGIVKPEGLEMIANRPVDVVLAPVDEILAFIKEHYSFALWTDASAAPAKKSQPALDVVAPEERLEPGPLPIPEAAAPPTPLLKLLTIAAAREARDVLLEKTADRVRVRFRIRGVLMTDLAERLSAADAADVFRFAAALGASTETGGVRLSEGHFRVPLGRERFFCRFALSETAAFSMLSVTLVPSRERAFDPIAWGMGPDQGRMLEGFLAKRQGLLLFCGWPGDDLAATLYSCAKGLVTPDRHVIAVQALDDDRLGGVERLVSGRSADRFSELLAAAARHQPDILIAHPLERRDHFEICMAEAHRGRLVLAAAFANDTADMVTKILTMGIDAYFGGSSLIAVIAQRSLRLLCAACHEPEPVSNEQMKALGIGVPIRPVTFYRGRGCEVCLGSGFDHETSVFEILEFTDDIRCRLRQNSTADEIRAMLKSTASMGLRQLALHKAMNGQTSLAEVLRSTP
ncbi:MAG: hypothetical protein JO102_05080 [Elusimicrobia bacterium]|nr:hypothetical protein [Elusimicrobiota bacterium]